MDMKAAIESRKVAAALVRDSSERLEDTARCIEEGSVLQAALFLTEAINTVNGYAQSVLDVLGKAAAKEGAIVDEGALKAAAERTDEWCRRRGVELENKLHDISPDKFEEAMREAITDILNE